MTPAQLLTHADIDQALARIDRWNPEIANCLRAYLQQLESQLAAYRPAVEDESLVPFDYSPRFAH